MVDRIYMGDLRIITQYVLDLYQNKCWNIQSIILLQDHARKNLSFFREVFNLTDIVDHRFWFFKFYPCSPKFSLILHTNSPLLLILLSSIILNLFYGSFWEFRGTLACIAGGISPPSSLAPANQNNFTPVH